MEEEKDDAHNQEEKIMESNFVAWPDIKLFHYLPKAISFFIVQAKAAGIPNEELHLYKRHHLEFRGKVKLHGSNAAVNIHSGQVRTQTRTIFSDDKTGKKLGISKLVQDNNDYFLSLQSSNWNQIVIFGEYCGPKVQKRVALSRLKSCIFAVFAIYIDSKILVEPEEIQNFMTKYGKVSIPNGIYILPWFTEPITLDLSNPSNSQKELDKIDNFVQEIDKEDPWVKETFGISGPGEGLVMYPISLSTEDHTGEFQVLDIKVFGTYSFKVKGASHAPGPSDEKKTSININPVKVESIQKYVDLMCTEARLEQGSDEIGLDLKKTKSFINWMINDIRKEGYLELEAANLSWESVEPIICKKCSFWFVNKCKELKNEQNHR